VIAAAIVLILIAAPLSGKLGDRFGKARVATVALCVFGLGLLIPFFTHAPVLVLPTLPFVAFGGGVILTLPYAMLMPLMPEDEHGLLTGFYSLTRGVGILAGPLLGGFAISLLRPSLTDTHGYAAMWLVCAAAILLSIPFTGALRRGEQKRRAGREKSTAEAAA
jgi:MFS family permease